MMCLQGRVVLIAVEIVVDIVDNTSSFAMDDCVVSGVRVVLNPGHNLVMREGTRVYVLADDMESILKFGICLDNEDEPPICIDDVEQIPSPNVRTHKTPLELTRVNHNLLRTSYRGAKTPREFPSSSLKRRNAKLPTIRSRVHQIYFCEILYTLLFML